MQGSRFGQSLFTAPWQAGPVKARYAAAAGAAVVAALAVYAAIPQDQAADTSRMHGSVSTALGSPVLGDPGAPVTIVEFGDYQCHQCYNWFHNSKPAIGEKYIETGRASLVFVDMAFLGRDSPVAAQASYCAEDQGMYWEYHGMLYGMQEPKIDGGWAAAERLKAFAFALGLDQEEFDSCLDSSKHERRVMSNVAEARKAGVTGTPTFVIVGPGGEQKIVGAQPYPVFERAIESVA